MQILLPSRLAETVVFTVKKDLSVFFNDERCDNIERGPAGASSVASATIASPTPAAPTPEATTPVESPTPGPSSSFNSPPVRTGRSGYDIVLIERNRDCFFDRIPGAAADHKLISNSKGPPRAPQKISGAGGHPRAAQSKSSLNPHISKG